MTFGSAMKPRHSIFFTNLRSDAFCFIDSTNSDAPVPKFASERELRRARETREPRANLRVPSTNRSGDDTEAKPRPDVGRRHRIDGRKAVVNDCHTSLRHAECQN